MVLPMDLFRLIKQMLQSIVYKIGVLSPTELRAGGLDPSMVFWHEEDTQLNMHHLRG